MKYFLGIALPEDIRNVLYKTTSGWPGYIWEKKSNLHLTLFYLGIVDGDIYSSLIHDLHTISIQEFTLKVDKTGNFSHRKNHTVLWAGMEKSESLDKLYNRVSNMAEKNGFKKEDHPFNPHITLLKSRKQGPEEFTDFRKGTSLILPLDWPVNEFHLFASQKDETGRVYTIVETFPLKG